MSTILGSNIHTTKAPWSEVEGTKFQGFDVNSYTKDCFGDTFEMNYPSGTKTVDNRGVIHFTKDGCITLNGVIYAGNQCLNVVYEAHTGKRLNKAVEAEDFMYQHADDPHLGVVYFHIYNDSSIVGDQLSNSNSVGTGVFITFGSTNNTRVFSQHYFWNNTHFYRVIASTATNKSGWIKVKDIHKINYDKENHRIQLLGIKNLTTSVKNESGFIGTEVSGVEIPVYKKGNNYPGLFDSTSIDLTVYLKKTEFDGYADLWDSTKGITYSLGQINTYFWCNDGESYIPKIIRNFNSYVTKSQLTAQSYVTKSQLTAQSYVTKSQLTAQSYVDNDTVKNLLYDYSQSLKSEINEVNNTVNKNSINISDLQNSYNTLNNSFNNLLISYNKLYNTVSYTISYHTSLFNYLISLHAGDSTVTSAPVTSAPITSISMQISNINNSNVLWDNSYLKEIVGVALNDESNVIGSTYSDNIIIPCNYINTNSYNFDMILYGYIIGGSSNSEFENYIYKDKGRELIWSGDTHSTTIAPLNEYETIRIKEYPYILKGSCGSTLNSYINPKNSYQYYIYAKYDNNTTTVPGSDTAYYTAQFKYIYPYLVCLGNTNVSYFEYPNDYVINDTTIKPKPTVTGSNYYQMSSKDVIQVKYINSWMHDSKYFTKYNVIINKSAVTKFNNGDYKLKVALNTCSPQVFRADNKNSTGSIL